ncbi:MAG: penicillin acylase family protein [Anaerolineales bacterium]
MAESDEKIKKSGLLSALKENIRILAILGKNSLMRTPMPVREGKLSLSGLSNPVEIIRDRWDVPHIYANALNDVFFAQGFIHAQERLWQMDFNRRLGSGRLSEILGADAIPLDRWIRTLSVRRVAELMKSNGASELCVESWCGVDFGLVEIFGGELKRSGTIAMGKGKCDFRFHKRK